MSSETISLFLNKALQRILKDSSRRHTQLRETIKVALDAIQGSQLSPEESPEWDRIATKLVIPLKHACETRQSKIMGTALDCLQKLMAYGLIRGTAIDEEKPDKKLIENVIETIGACFDFPDDNVQLQIIKAFLTAVTSPICDIHDNCLMNAIRSVYNIYLVTKNQVNITTAKATLTQMLNIIFQRMEVSKNASQPNSPALPRNNNNNTNNNNTNNNNANPETPNGNFVTPTDITEESTSKDTVLASSSSSITSPPMSPSTKHGSTNIHFNDCFLIFRALCKLSMKEVPEGAGPDAMDMKSKLLSLELIQMILESSGPAFRHSERFVNSAIKKYLCASLLNNGVSPVPRVFKLSLSIFLALMSHFRENLKAEIGVFFSRIFLWILENNNSTIQQKWMVLQVLYQICKNPQTLVDIFVNYDCDPEAKDIFERMVYDLSRIAQGGNTVSGDHFSAPAAQELKVKTLGLECLVTIMKSLVDWSKELYEQTEKENVTETTDGSSSTVTTTTEDLDGLEQMRKQKQFKLVIETGKQKFNVSPKKGIDYLIQGEVIENTAASISNFLKATEGLDRTKIGEYLGDSDPFIISVLYAYVDLFSFQRLAIDTALREFLSYFRLPSDGHKIDRMLEKFAERYFNDNQPSSAFANADAVYTLAFAIVVLLTDLHSPTVQTKMTKQDWFKMNKGCNGSGDFDYNMLYVIYDNCAQEPLRLRGEKDGYGTTLASTSATDPGTDKSITIPAPASPHEDNYLRSLAVHISNVLMFWSIDSRQKQLRFIKESEELVKSSQASIQEKMKRKAKFFTATHIEHVRPMFELAWCPMLAAFSVLLEDSEDGRVIALCLEGFNYAIHVACIFFMAIERSTFITSLSKFTLLDSLREMRPKNIESIKAVINIANTQGNYLQESWAQVLKCFSLLERLHVIGSGVKINALSYTTEPDPKKYTRGFTTDFFGAKPNPKAFEEVNAEYVAQQIDTSAVDRVYTNSIHLSNSAIVSFVKSLCEVSVEEINNAAPRIFSLQKLVEICYYNMNRLRIVWASIWGISASHFTKIGCHDNKGIAMYAIDSLRQLSMKFLEKDELAHYTFQKEFLRPFEHIIHNNPSVDIREFVIRCLTQMIQALGKNIKSGWKSVFLVFATAASDPDPQIVNLAFTTVDHLMQDYFAAVADTFFIDCVSCVAAFSWNKHDPAISQKSIDWLNFCSAQLYTGKVEPLPSPTSDGVIFTNSDRHTSLWFPILTGLTKSTQHKDSNIRISSLQVLFRQLSMYGRSFSNDLWGLILQKVLLPIFEPTGYDGKTILNPLTEDTEWLTTTCTEAFRLLVEFYTDFFDKISFLLYAILDLVVACILQDNETLSRKAMATLLSLTLSNGPKLTDEMWSTICSEYGQILEQNLPHEIFQLQSHARMAATAQAAQAQAQLQNPPQLQLTSLAPPSVTSPTSTSAPPTPFMSSSTPNVSTPVVTSSPLSQSIPQISIDGAPDADPPTASPRMAPKRVRKASSTTSSVMLDFANTIRSKCTVQLLSIQAISDIFFSQYSSLSTHHMISLVDSLDVVYNFSYKINREPSITSTLAKMNLLELFQKLELQAILSYLQMLFKLYSESAVDARNRKHQAELRLISRCAHILSNADKGETSLPTENALSRNHPNNIAIIVQVLKGFLSLSNEQFASHLPQFYGEFVDLMLHGSKEVRQVLSEVMQRVGPTFSIAIEYPPWLDRDHMDRFLEKPKARKPVVRDDDAYIQGITEPRDSPSVPRAVAPETQTPVTTTPAEPTPGEGEQVVKVETVVTTEEVQGNVELAGESENSTTTEIIVQDVPSDQLPADTTTPYSETTTFTEVEVVATPDGGSKTNLIASGQITTVVEVTSEPSEPADKPSELAAVAPEPIAEPAEPTPETAEPVVEPTPEPEPTTTPTAEPELTSSSSSSTPQLEPETTEPTEPAEPQTQTSEPEPQTSEPAEPTNAEAEDQDDFVMVESPSQQHPPPSNPFEDQPSDHSDSSERSDLSEDTVVVAPEETPLVQSEKTEETEKSEENDEFPDELSASDTPIFDSATASALVDGTIQKEEEKEDETTQKEEETKQEEQEEEEDETDLS